MSNKTLFKGEVLHCPHCERQLVGFVERYCVFSGGKQIKENLCPLCGKKFYVEHIGHGQYLVDKEAYDDFDEDEEKERW